MSYINFDPYHLTLILIALISGVISPVIVQLTKYYISLLRLPKKGDQVGKSLKYEDLITNKLEKIKEFYNADRVWVLEFHNGNHLYSGQSLQKFSVTYEAVGPGIAREGIVTQNIPTSLFSAFFRKLSESNFFEIKNTNDNKSSMQSFFESRGTKSFVSVGIRNIENVLIGALCVESIKAQLNINESSISRLMVDANILSGYLETFNV